MGPKRFGAGEARSAAAGARTDRPVRTTTAGGNRMRPVPNGGKPAHHFPDTAHTPRPPPRPGADGQRRETRRPEGAPTGEGIAAAKVQAPICGPHIHPGKPGNGRKTCFASRSSSSGNTWWRNSHQAFTRESGAPPRPSARQGAPGPPRETPPPPPGDGPIRQLGAPQRIFRTARGHIDAAARGAKALVGHWSTAAGLPSAGPQPPPFYGHLRPESDRSHAIDAQIFRGFTRPQVRTSA